MQLVGARTLSKCQSDCFSLLFHYNHCSTERDEAAPKAGYDQSSAKLSKRDVLVRQCGEDQWMAKCRKMKARRGRQSECLLKKATLGRQSEYLLKKAGSQDLKLGWFCFQMKLKEFTLWSGTSSRWLSNEEVKWHLSQLGESTTFRHFKLLQRYLPLALEPKEAFCCQ